MTVRSQEGDKMIVGEAKKSKVIWKRDRLPYKSSKNITEVIETLPLRHHIFGFAGPLSSLPLCFVFGYPLDRWLFSWIDERWFSAICNGTSLVTNNVFIRVPISSECIESSDDNEWRGLKKLDEYSPVEIVEMYCGENSEIDSMPMSDAGVPEMFDFHSDNREKFNIQPVPGKGKTIIIDHPDLEDEDREWTHYFYSPLLEVDLRTVFSAIYEDDRQEPWMIGRALVEDITNPYLGFWNVINAGWNIRGYLDIEAGFDIVYEGKPIALDVALWNDDRLGDALFYHRFLREKGITSRVEEESPCADEFFEVRDLSSHFSNWYLVHIGATLLEDMKIEIKDYREAVRDGQMEYAELFLKNISKKEFKEFHSGNNEMSRGLSEFKMLEKYTHIVYSDLLPIRESQIQFSHSSGRAAFILKVMKALGGSALMISAPESYRVGLKIKSNEIFKYLMKSKGVDALLPRHLVLGEGPYNLRAFRIEKLSQMAVTGDNLSPSSVEWDDECTFFNNEIITMMIVEIATYIDESKSDYRYNERVAKFATCLSDFRGYSSTSHLFGRSERIASLVSSSAIREDNIGEWISTFK